MKNDVIERFNSKVDQRGPDECWPWMGSCGPRGYGTLCVDGRNARATRLSLELSGKPRPSDKHVACHTCDEPNCVNPAHLWWGTMRDNMQDATAKGRLWNNRKTHCINGHPLEGANLRIVNGHERRCYRCALDVQNKHRAGVRAAALAQANLINAAGKRTGITYARTPQEVEKIKNLPGFKWRTPNVA